MRYLVSASEMREYDSNTIERIGIPACVLMERAALAAVEAIEERCAGGGRAMPVLVMAGMGNNGGDGLAVARLLCEKGYRVEVWTVGVGSHGGGSMGFWWMPCSAWGCPERWKAHTRRP